MEVDSVESLEKSPNSSDGNITTNNTVFSNEGAGDHVELNMEVDSTETRDKLSNDDDIMYDNMTSNNNVLSNEGVLEDQTEHNMEVDPVINHDVLLNDKFTNINPNSIFSSKGIEVQNTMNLSETLEQNNSVLDIIEIETSDQPIEEVIDAYNDETSEQLISGQIDELTTETTVQPIIENHVNTSSEQFETIVSHSYAKPLVQENIFHSISGPFDQPLKENIYIQSYKPTKNNNVKISDQLFETIISSTEDKPFEPPVNENILDSISESFDQPIEENHHWYVSDEESDKVYDEESDKEFDEESDKEFDEESDKEFDEESDKESYESSYDSDQSSYEDFYEVSEEESDEEYDLEIGTFDQTGNKTTIVSNPIYDNIAVSDVEISNQPIKKKPNESGGTTSKQSPEKIISPKGVEESDQPLKGITVETSKQPTKNINESSNNLIQKNITEPDVKISEQQLLKKTISVSTVGNTLSNLKLPFIPIKTEYLNLDKIAVPETAESNVNSNLSLLSSQLNKVKPMSVVSSNQFVRIQPKLIPTENNVLKQKQEVKIVSSSELKSGVLVVPHNGTNIAVQNEEPNNELLKSNSMPSARKLNSTETSQSSEKNQKCVSIVEKSPKKICNVIPLAKASDCNPKTANNFIFKSEKKPVSMKFLNAHGLTIVPQKTNLSLTPTSYPKFNTIKKDIKLIPHTITSKDLIESKTKTVLESNKDKINTNTNQKMGSSSNLHLLPKTNNKGPPPLQPFSSGKNINMQDDFNSKFHIIPIKTKLNLNAPKNNYRLKPKVIQNDNKSTVGITEVHYNETYKPKADNNGVEKTSDKNKVSFTTESIKKKRKILLEGCYTKYNDLVACENEDCDALAFESELVDEMYCSIDCKRWAERKIIFKIPSPPPPNSSTKAKVDRQLVLLKLQKSIRHRKKQKLLMMDSKPSVPNGERNASQHSSEQTNGLDTVKRVKSISMIPKIYPELSGLNEFNTVDYSSCEPIEWESYPTPVQTMDTNIPNVPLLADDAYLRSIEEGKQILNYVKRKEFKSAPKKLFDKPFPEGNNIFKVGQKLEGIDPEHEALFCVLSVAEIRGYRVRLHFDGYSDDYDFWVNADCPNLFHIKWCQENSRTVQPPYNYEKPFDWSLYLKENGNVFPAPKSCFTSSINAVYYKDHKFTTGLKLEALDKVTRTLPKQLICVATVADVIGNRIRVHFDGWSDDFDYWTCILSTNIHPIGWCGNNGRLLTPPCGFNDFKGKKPFSWTEYLKETNSKPVPEDAFTRMPLREFTIGMAIEVVDLVIPSLIRVAIVKDVKDNEIKILYDGFHPTYAYWVEDDSPDIHPVGWCFKTHHPLEIPPESSVWSCKVVGCNGKGNLFHYKTDHINAKDCPYEFDAWKKSVNGLLKVRDRLKPEETIKPVISAKNSKSKRIENQEKEKCTKIESPTTDNCVFVKPDEIIDPTKSNHELGTTSRKSVHSRDGRKYKKSSFDAPQTMTTVSLKFARYQLLGDKVCFTTDPMKWSIKEVAEYVDITVNNKYAKNASACFLSHRFIDNEIDGESFLMLTKDDLLKILHLPLGPAIKIYHTIKLLQERSIILSNIIR